MCKRECNKSNVTSLTLLLLLCQVYSLYYYYYYIIMYLLSGLILIRWRCRWDRHHPPDAWEFAFCVDNTNIIQCTKQFECIPNFNFQRDRKLYIQMLMLMFLLIILKLVASVKWSDLFDLIWTEKRWTMDTWLEDWELTLEQIHFDRWSIKDKCSVLRRLIGWYLIFGF